MVLCTKGWCVCRGDFHAAPRNAFFDAESASEPMGSGALFVFAAR